MLLVPQPGAILVDVLGLPNALFIAIFIHWQLSNSDCFDHKSLNKQLTLALTMTPSKNGDPSGRSHLIEDDTAKNLPDGNFATMGLAAKTDRLAGRCQLG